MENIDLVFIHNQYWKENVTVLSCKEKDELIWLDITEVFFLTFHLKKKIALMVATILLSAISISANTIIMCLSIVLEGYS